MCPYRTSHKLRLRLFVFPYILQILIEQIASIQRPTFRFRAGLGAEDGVGLVYDVFLEISFRF